MTVLALASGFFFDFSFWQFIDGILPSLHVGLFLIDWPWEHDVLPRGNVCYYFCEVAAQGVCVLRGWTSQKPQELILFLILYSLNV